MGFTGAGAQVTGAPRRIAVLIPGTQSGYRWQVDALRRELLGLGYLEGRDIAFDARFADDRTDRLVLLANELAATKPAVIVTLSGAGIAACRQATSTIPIVFTAGSAPVEQGFVKSLGRPGGNVTGVTTHLEIASKIVEIAREAMPGAQRIAVLAHQPDPAHKRIVDQFVAASGKYGFRPLVVLVNDAGDLDRAFRDMAERKADALYPANLVFNLSHIREIVDRSLRGKLPLFTSYVDEFATGGLVSYGTEREENYRRAAAQIDKILRGANPGELPVEQPGKFRLVVNLRTAKAIGVTLPPVIMLRADRVIE